MPALRQHALPGLRRDSPFQMQGANAADPHRLPGDRQARGSSVIHGGVDGKHAWGRQPHVCHGGGRPGPSPKEGFGRCGWVGLFSFQLKHSADKRPPFLGLLCVGKDIARHPCTHTKPRSEKISYYPHFVTFISSTAFTDPSNHVMPARVFCPCFTKGTQWVFRAASHACHMRMSAHPAPSPRQTQVSFECIEP